MEGSSRTSSSRSTPRGRQTNIRWEWVDWTEREIRLPDTKNGEGRVVPIAGELVALMERLRDSRTVEKSDGSAALSEWVFHVEGSWISLKRYRRAWASVRKAARLEGRLFHDFRRTGAWRSDEEEEDLRKKKEERLRKKEERLRKKKEDEDRHKELSEKLLKREEPSVDY